MCRLYILANLNLASRLPEGSVAALSLADRLRPSIGFLCGGGDHCCFHLSGMWAREIRKGSGRRP